jgi:hypothetical protein
VDFSMKEILDRYAGDKPMGRRYRGSELEIIVWRWLVDLTQSGQARRGTPIPDPLKKVLPAIAGGTVKTEGGD